MEILIATGNKGKVKEYKQMFASLPLTLLSLQDVGLGDMDVEENGSTFEANAAIKARAYAEASGKWALADDSGLCVDALNGAPGVHSARYGGPGLTDADRRHRLLGALTDIPDDKRMARFVCVIALANPATGQCLFSQGSCAGAITRQEIDEGHGFGYDPIFTPQGHTRTFAQIPKDEKNVISHRGRAAQAIVPILREIIKGE